MLQIRSAAMGWVKEPGAEHQTPVFLRNKTAQVVSKLVQVGCTYILLSMSLAWHCQPMREASNGRPCCPVCLLPLSRHKPQQCAQPALPLLCTAATPALPTDDYTCSMTAQALACPLIIRWLRILPGLSLVCQPRTCT